MLDAKLVVLDRVARLRVAVGAAEVEEVGGEEREHVLGEVGRQPPLRLDPASRPAARPLWTPGW